MSENKFLIASDLDGTLLTDNKKIKLKTKLFVHKFIREGNIFLISTGRSPRTAINFQNKLRIKAPIIMFNGNLIYDTSKKNIVVKEILWKKEKIKKIFSTLLKENLIDGAFSETKKHLFFYNRNYFNFLENGFNNIDIIEGEINKTITEDSYNFVIHNSNDSPKIRKQIVKTINSIYNDIDVDFWGSDSDGNIMASLLHKGINKAVSVEYLREKYKINKENVLAFGDSTNDIQMITKYENGWAMKNCFPSLKKYAKRFTKKDNNHNGVVYEAKAFLKTKV